MNTKIKNYVDVVFAEIPRTQKASELKAEILANMNDHYNELVGAGKTDVQAYAETVENAGDFDVLLKDLIPDSDLKEKIEGFRQKKAQNTAIAIMLYILAVIFPILFSTLFSFTNGPIIGVVLLLVFVACATGLIIYTNMSIPSDVSSYILPKDSFSDGKESMFRSNTFRSLLSFYWTLIVIIYLGISFLTARWDITWLIWIVAVALEQGFKLVYDINKK
jgi:hypothetical protein